MSEDFSGLFEPGFIGNLEIPNRIVMAPMGTYYAGPDGRFTPRHMDYFAARARGGAGLIITELTKVERRIENSPRMRLVYAGSDAMMVEMADLTRTVHDFGTKIALQLTAGLGRQADVVDTATPPVSCSPLPAFADPSVICHELTVEEIQEIVGAFGDAAERARIAGFDMVEIHGHTGFLLDQFLSTVWNQRTDEYGGSLENRMRFTLEVVSAIKKRAGSDFPVCFRMAVEHGIPGGRTIEESQEIARRLESAGVDAIHADAGCYETIDLIFPAVYLGDGCFDWAASAIKEVVNIPVIAVGNIIPEIGSSILASGKADFIAVGRGFIADPDWPAKIRNGQREDVRPCIRCNQKCVGDEWFLKSASCAVNSQVGKERYYELKKTGQPKKVLVIGGGPAGMEAARVASIRGHHVTLMEKDEELGGQLRAGATSPFKQVMKDLLQWYTVQMEKLGIDVRPATEATEENVRSFGPDVIVAATGARPIIPEIPGIDKPNVTGIIDFYLRNRPVEGDWIAIAGGGLSGCEAALELAQEGKKVTILEMRSEVAIDLNFISRFSLIRNLKEHEVALMTDYTVCEFRADGVVARTREGKEDFFPADAVIAALGMEPVTDLFSSFREMAPEFYSIGDCVKPAKMAEAVHSGFAIGWRI